MIVKVFSNLNDSILWFCMLSHYLFQSSSLVARLSLHHTAREVQMTFPIHQFPVTYWLSPNPTGCLLRSSEWHCFSTAGFAASSHFLFQVLLGKPCQVVSSLYCPLLLRSSLSPTQYFKTTGDCARLCTALSKTLSNQAFMKGPWNNPIDWKSTCKMCWHRHRKSLSPLLMYVNEWCVAFSVLLSCPREKYFPICICSVSFSYSYVVLFLPWNHCLPSVITLT